MLLCTVRPPQEADDFCLSETADYVAGTFAKALEDKVLGSLDTARLRNWRDKSKLFFFKQINLVRRSL